HNLASGTTLAIANAITGNGILEFSSDAAPATGDLNRVTVGSLSGFTGDISVLANGMFGNFTAGNTTNQNLTIALGGFMAMSEDIGFGRLNGAGKIIRNVGGNTTRTLTLGNNNASGGNFSGSIEGASITSGTLNSSGIIAVTKVGTGVQTLSGANTYTGPTTINAGTLALGANNALANTTAVSIGNATLDASTFTDTVGTLDPTSSAKINLGTGAALAFANSSAIDWTGGTLSLTGTFVSGSSLRFGTTSSGLTPAQLARITGPGVPAFALDANGYLIPGLTADYTSWKTTNAPTGAPSDDFDGDGVANGIEYVLGGTASIRDFGKLPGFSTAGGNLAFTFIRDQASIDGTTAITIEVGETLTDWPQSFPVPDTAATNNPGLTVVKNSPSAGQDTVTLILPLNPGGKTF
ncbi:MAG: hypothetical protein CFE26_21370, partial [Verrucomicrobiales bacterium VVV1]